MLKNDHACCKDARIYFWGGSIPDLEFGGVGSSPTAFK